MPRGRPFDLADLRSLGISPQLAARYVKNGWLERLGPGVYGFLGDNQTRDGCVLFLQQRVRGLHVGGKSALAMHAVQHNLPARDVLILWGDQRFTLPEWFTLRFPSRYVGATLFDSADPQLARATVMTPPGVTSGLRVSTPERAALEMLYEVGTNQSLDEARNLFQGLRNLRQDLMGRLLASCRSVKAVRLFLTWSRQTGVLDADAMREHYRLRVGGQKRWIARLKDGTLLALKQYG